MELLVTIEAKLKVDIDSAQLDELDDAEVQRLYPELEFTIEDVEEV